ncbi:nuclear transport factor 2 family protein [Pontibacter sp. H249]|uniref:nuclear transport factor 2 family protein n=1 Tax=Pontibacter sp. H249 TaxID=3133420 RepID=UPI0030C39E86
MENQTLRHIIQKYIEAYNQFDVDSMLQYMHEDVKFQNISGSNVTLAITGKTAFREQAELAKTYFTQREQSIKNIQEQGHEVEVTIDYKAILAVDLSDNLKAGDTISLQGKSVFIFADNKIIELKDYS